eukprot:1162015-Pelagomonas_calceolata.AAC.3
MAAGGRGNCWGLLHRIWRHRVDITQGVWTCCRGARPHRISGASHGVCQGFAGYCKAGGYAAAMEGALVQLGRFSGKILPAAACHVVFYKALFLLYSGYQTCSQVLSSRSTSTQAVFRVDNCISQANVQYSSISGKSALRERGKGCAWLFGQVAVFVDALISALLALPDLCRSLCTQGHGQATLLAFPQHKPSSAEVDFPAAPVCSCQCMIAMRLYSSKTCAPVLAQVKMPDTKEPVRVRVGMHTDRNVTNENLCLLSQHMKHYMLTNPTGNVVSGLIGSKLPKFSIFGDTMNTASRMESTGGLIKTSTTWLQTTLRACFSKTSRNMTFCMPPAAGIPGRIHVSEATQRLLQNVEHWEPTGGVEVKGKRTAPPSRLSLGTSKTLDADRRCSSCPPNILQGKMQTFLWVPQPHRPPSNGQVLLPIIENSDSEVSETLPGTLLKTTNALLSQLHMTGPSIYPVPSESQISSLCLLRQKLTGWTAPLMDVTKRGGDADA